MSHHRWFIGAGLALMLSGLLHFLVGFGSNASWEGSVSIRKPIFFGFSTGLTMISLGWIQRRLRPANYDAIGSPLFAIAILIEVALISMQFWRGKASHFNHSTPFDYAVDRVMTGLIIFAAIVILDLTRRSFKFIQANREMQLAIRAGMAFLSISCGLGFFILFYGEHLASLNQAPEKFGKAGVMKFPHGVVIHAIQLFPVLVWAMRKLNIRSEKRLELLRFSIASTTAFLIFSLVQTFSGRARFDLGLAGAVALIITFSLLVPVIQGFFLAVQDQFRRRRRQSLNSM